MTPDWAARPTAVPYAVFGDPQSLNLYGYVRNDPVSAADIDGHQAERDVLYDMSDNSPFSYGFQIGLVAPGDLLSQSNQQNKEIRAQQQLLAEAQNTTQTQTQPNQQGQQTQSTSGTKPDCFAQLKTRDVDDWRAQLVGATHSFWYVQGSDGQQQVISGGPSTDGKNHLDVWVHGTNDGVDNVHAATTWNSGLSPANCSGVDHMLSTARSWNQTAITYNAQSGPTSNSVAHSLGITGGFSPPAPHGSFGWNTPIP